MSKLIRCGRCGRRLRNADGWNVTLEAGVVVGHTCPDCQTPVENSEAEINDATVVYGRRADGRIVGRPKGAQDVNGGAR